MNKQVPELITIRTTPELRELLKPLYNDPDATPSKWIREAIKRRLEKESK
jgi:predicted DNA-binding protein